MARRHPNLPAIARVNHVWCETNNIPIFNIALEEMRDVVIQRFIDGVVEDASHVVGVLGGELLSLGNPFIQQPQALEAGGSGSGNNVERHVWLNNRFSRESLCAVMMVLKGGCESRFQVQVGGCRYPLPT